MNKLPPMLQAPTPDQLNRARKREGLQKRRETLARKTEYRKALLLWMAESLERCDSLPPARPVAQAYGLSPDQGASVRRVIAHVLHNRAEEHEGRLRV